MRFTLRGIILCALRTFLFLDLGRCSHALGGNRVRLWIFDLDGTLTDSFPLFFENMQMICAERGVQISLDDLKACLSGPLPPIFERLLGPGTAPAAMARLKDLSIERAHHSPLYEGIEETLDVLRSAGRDIAVWTARDKASAEHLLKATGLNKYATQLVSGCCVPRNKPYPDGAQLLLERFGRLATEGVMIGDHEHDVSAARDAGLLGVRASWNELWGREACAIARHQFHDVASFRAWVVEAMRGQVLTKGQH
ncbi:MAG: HAD family hydrolase [Proteobacteria bacterium]|nr:MAG: HAD family hydrolase [Pseudomonadota bacterium]